MLNKVDFSIATSDQIEGYICSQIKKIRLSRNFTQVQLAKESGVAIGTIRRLEEGESVTINTFIRVLIALGLQQNLETLLPDSSIRPIERVNNGGSERKRARPKQSDTDNSTWVWGDESGDKK
ncbi:MAG: transcriptional regulator [Chloroflexi bacterium HGW-Chloroflexi-5]|jgi:transcriptional regulator with XRE-family HTH domain|nr:MAG: transcriptional regulator [Chloroflexi bacterium HGW-Chloroflexi-5]